MTTENISNLPKIGLEEEDAELDKIAQEAADKLVKAHNEILPFDFIVAMGGLPAAFRHAIDIALARHSAAKDREISELKETINQLVVRKDRLVKDARDNKAEGDGYAAELAALREDKARLDWLETHDYCLMCWNVDQKINNGWTISRDEKTEIQGQTAREAIDAARAALTKQEEK